MTDRGGLVALIAASTALRLALAASVGPGNDEAYHALFAVHPAWSYFDHPPMMAWVARAGMLLSGGQLSAPAMRVGFVLLAAGSTWMMARLTSRFFGPRAGLIAAFLLNATAYYGVAAGTFILPDGPLLFFWLLSLDRLAAALEDPDRVAPWVGLGLAWGAAMLSKYHAIFLPAGAVLYLAIEPPARRCLRRPGPYLSAAIGSILFAPVVLWNHAHHWASFAFQGARAGGTTFRPDAMAMAVAGQALYLLPWVWVFLWASVIRAWPRARREGGSPERFLIAQILLPTVAFLVVASRRDVLPHWSLVGMIPAFPLLGRDWAPLAGRRVKRRFAMLAALPVLGVGLFIAQTRTGILPIDPAYDPTVDLAGWSALGEELARRGLTGREDQFLFTSKWYYSGHVAFATGNRVPVACYAWRGGHSFDDWEPSQGRIGQSGVLLVVNTSATEPEIYRRFFERIEPLGALSIERGGRPIRRVRLFRCVRQLGPLPTIQDPSPASPAESPAR